MSIHSILASKWVMVPYGIVVLFQIGVAAFLTVRLATFTPGLYT